MDDLVNHALAWHQAAAYTFRREKRQMLRWPGFATRRPWTSLKSSERWFANRPAAVSYPCAETVSGPQDDPIASMISAWIATVFS
jgi:hypothetical protein